jgi:hypothetical protein
MTINSFPPKEGIYMLHSRKDYNRIQDPLRRIGKTEPVFLIRAQDIAAPAAVDAYAIFAERFGASAELVNKCRAWAVVMRDWQEQHKAKVPDLPSADNKKTKQ